MRKLTKLFRMILPTEPKAESEFIQVHTHRMPVLFRRHPRAKTYVLRIHPDKTVVVTMPPRGSKKFALDFVASRKVWLEKQWRVLESRQIPPHVLRPGMEILFRGRSALLELTKKEGGWQLRLGTELLPVVSPPENLRPVIERHLLNVARVELVERVHHLALKHGSKPTRVLVRNQKSRWGSCSCNGTISINWRLVQLPSEVRDYIIIHELMHLRELNHSPRYWAQVAKACPNYLEAEEWLKTNSGRVGF